MVKARWVFGPHFDSPEYVSNRSIRLAVEEAFGVKADAEDFINHRKRPDLIVRSDSTIYSAGTERVDSSSLNDMARLEDVLVVELKRGGFSIGRQEINQAS